MLADNDSLASTVGSGGLPVFSTPAMIALMERAAARAVEPFLCEGRITVGSMIDVRHLAASPPGAEITATAVLEGIEGRRLLFRVSASDGSGMIGEGTHGRVIVDIERFMRRVAERDLRLIPAEKDGSGHV
jgi:predicted thioesterase